MAPAPFAAFPAPLCIPTEGLHPRHATVCNALNIPLLIQYYIIPDQQSSNPNVGEDGESLPFLKERHWLNFDMTVNHG